MNTPTKRDPRNPCCAMMNDHLTQTCPDHPNPADCPDCLVTYRRRGGGMGYGFTTAVRR